MDCFCNAYRPKHDQLRHDVLLTDFLLSYPEAINLWRGWNIEHGADAVFTLDGNRYFVELDTGLESYSVVQRRQRAYTGVHDYLLYVTLTERRLQGLIRHSESVQKIALFTTLAQTSEPHGEIWVDCYGNRCAI